MAQPGKVDQQPGFVLMSQPWRETSLLIEVLTRAHGRLTLIARSARRPQSTLRGVLMPFAPLELAWFGKGELRTLHSADWLGGVPQLSGLALLSGMYLNELIVRLTIRDDPYPGLYDSYHRAVQALAGIANPDSFRQQINPEGWGLEAPPQLAVPGQRDLPPSSRALSTLANQRGRVY